MKLLIIEDEAILREKYKKYLESEFVSISLCENLSEARELIQNESFHILLIDYNLPDGNGLEVLELFPDQEDAPVSVMITAYSKEKVAIQSLNLGVFRYLEKPVDKEKLLETLQQALREARKREQVDDLIQRFSVSQKAQDILIQEYQISAREMDVLKSVLIHGKNNNVALLLNIGQGTVRNHLSNIFQKLHINNKDELKALIKNLNS